MSGVAAEARGAGQDFLDWARQLELSFLKLYPHQRSRGRGQMPQLAVLPLPEAVKRRKGSEFADSGLAAWHGICARLADLQAVLKRMRGSDVARSPQSEHTPTDPAALEKHGNGLKKAVVDFATKLEPQAHKHSPEQSQVLLRCRSLDHVSLEGL